MSSGNYVLQLLDSYGDGWSSSSVVTLSFDGASPIGPHALSSGNQATYSFILAAQAATDLQDIVYIQSLPLRFKRDISSALIC